MKRIRLPYLLLLFILTSSLSFGQSQKPEKWKTIVDDELTTISYNENITTGKSGTHFVWVKAVHHTPEWQRYFADEIGIRTPVVMTKTKAEYDEIYSFVRVRQVICYSKAGKTLYDTGDGTSAGWWPVNASDPVGIVGEYLGDILDKEQMYNNW